jgi:hypothetical protein
VAQATKFIGPHGGALLLTRQGLETGQAHGLFCGSARLGALFIDSCIGIGSAFSDACWLFLGIGDFWLVGVGVLIFFF